MPRATFGVIFGNRNFFPDRLIGEGRSEVLGLLQEMGIDAVALGEQSTKLGAVETWRDAQACADLFKENQHRIDGILVCLPNFGDEKGVADAIRLSGLRVPILVQAYPDDITQFTVERRRDAFCGKISVCNNLTQYGYPFSLTTLHTVSPSAPSFRSDLERFIGVCHVANGMRRARLGMVGTRPNAFNTVRFSEKILERFGVTVNVIDLSEVFGAAGRLPDDHARVTEKVDAIHGYANVAAVPVDSLLLMAKLGVVLDDWMAENDLQATAIQCWNSIQLNYGVNSCTIMSMMSQNLMPSACETDVTGLAAMYALQLASGRPSALVDWNNNYGDDPDKCVFFHCGNWAKEFLPDITIGTAEILGTILGEENTYGATAGRTPAGPLTFGRITTDDINGRVRAYVGEGRYTDDPLATFGSSAVVEIPRMQELLRYICRNGFEHHGAMNPSRTAESVAEALETYLGWDVYRHAPDARLEDDGTSASSPVSIPTPVTA